MGGAAVKPRHPQRSEGQRPPMDGSPRGGLEPLRLIDQGKPWAGAYGRVCRTSILWPPLLVCSCWRRLTALQGFFSYAHALTFSAKRGACLPGHGLARFPSPAFSTSFFSGFRG